MLLTAAGCGLLADVTEHFELKHCGSVIGTADRLRPEIVTTTTRQVLRRRVAVR